MFVAVGLFGRAFCAIPVFLALALCAVLAAADAEAAKKNRKIAEPEEPAMRIVIVRGSYSSCEPNCPEWISAEGRIYASSSGALRKVLKKMGPRKLPVVVNSPGGDIDAAMRMGRMIRERGLDVAVGYTLFTGCRPTDASCKPPKEDKGVYRGTMSAVTAYCHSACPLILAGGKRRLVGLTASVGVHRVTSHYSKTLTTYREWYKIVKGKKRVVSRKVLGRKVVGSYTSTKIDPRVSRSIAKYLREMGIGPSLQKLMEATPADQIRVLSPVEVGEANLITNGFPAESLTGAKSCATAPYPANCVKR
jgi:hypothetical protein